MIKKLYKFIKRSVLQMEEYVYRELVYFLFATRVLIDTIRTELKKRRSSV